MKVKILKRNSEDYLRETKNDIHKVQRNYDPDHHPFEAAREYTRALNAVKLERVFAKPFLGSLDGHRDGISAFAKHPTRLSWLASSSCDGEVRLWDLSTRKCMTTFSGHKNYARSLTFSSQGSTLISVADDKQILTWKTDEDEINNSTPIHAIPSKGMVNGITHHRIEDKFATCGENTTLWQAGRTAPIKEFNWGIDSVHAVKFNQVETNLLGACASDRSIILYDIRDKQPLRKVILELKSNSIAWNPMEAMIFTVANEDYNLYAFDVRKLNRPLNVHMDHVSAVIDLDYSPTGKEFVSGSYDKTIRIFNVHEGHSREIYHTKRMQRLTAVEWSLDNKYIISGSDEMNIRLWKARASEKIAVLKDRERSSLEYCEKLKEKYGNHPQVKRISRHRKIPKHVKNAREEHRIIKESKARKQSNVRKHSKPGSVPYVSERDKHVIEEKE